jgi:hypothetical protein
MCILSILSILSKTQNGKNRGSDILYLAILAKTPFHSYQGDSFPPPKQKFVLSPMTRIGPTITLALNSASSSTVLESAAKRG